MPRQIAVTVGQVEAADGFILGTTEPKPDDGSVGVRAGVTLEPYSGDLLFTADDQVIEGLDISGRVMFNGYKRCKLRNSIIRIGTPTPYGTTAYAITSYDGGGRLAANNLVEFCEVRPSTPSVDTYGIGGWGWTVYRSIIVDVVDAANMHKSPSAGGSMGGKFNGNYVETEYYAVDPRHGGGPTHNDLVQVFAGPEDEIIGNSATMPSQVGNGVVFTPLSDGNLINPKVNYNWLRGAYTQIAAWDSGSEFVAVPGLQVIGNRHGVGPNGTSGDHRWDLLLTQENYDLRDQISGNIVLPGGAAAHININN